MQPIYAIVVMSKNHVIGKNNQLLWHLPDDLKHFKNLTLHQVIIMGRKTYTSIGKALPSRINIVITHDEQFVAPDCTVVSSISAAFSEAEKYADKKIFVIGGGEIYRQAMPFITTIYLTLVDANIDGDTYFPELNSEEWIEVKKEKHPADARHLNAFEFVELQRRQ